MPEYLTLRANEKVGYIQQDAAQGDHADVRNADEAVQSTHSSFTSASKHPNLQYGYENYQEAGGGRAIQSLSDVRQNHFLDHGGINDTEEFQRDINRQPWQVLQDAVTFDRGNAQTQKVPDKLPRSKRAGGTEIVQVEISIDQSKQKTLDHTSSTEDKAKVAIPREDRLSQIITDPYPNELLTQIESVKSIQPWEAIENSKQERETDEKQFDSHGSGERIFESNMRDENTTLRLSEARKIFAKESDDRQNTATSIYCHVPSELAQALIDMDFLEPATVDYLSQKYNYVENHLVKVPSSAVEQISKLSTEHAHEALDVDFGMHETDTALQSDYEQYQSRSPKLSEQFLQGRFTDASDNKDSGTVLNLSECTDIAQTQIEQIERMDKTLQQSPHLNRFSTLTIRTDSDNNLQVTEVMPAVFNETEYPSALHEVLCGRAEQTLTAVPETRGISLTKTRQSHSIISTIQRDLKRHEHELERLADSEPQPHDFVTICFSQSKIWIRDYWSARTVEEFDSINAGIPATPLAIRSIVAKDREYKQWLARKNQTRVDLEQGRKSEYEQLRLEDAGYDLKDLDR